MSWEQVYNFFGIKELIYFISDPRIQDMLFPVKLVFACFSTGMFILIIYFMMNSSWLQYKFLEDVTEFFAWQSYGLREVSRRLARIKKRTESGSDADYKLAIIDLDDFLNEVFDYRGYEGKTFEDSVKKAGRLIMPSQDEVIQAHQTRNSIVYNPNFNLSQDQAKKIMTIYESAINSIGL